MDLLPHVVDASAVSSRPYLIWQNSAMPQRQPGTLSLVRTGEKYEVMERNKKGWLLVAVLTVIPGGRSRWAA